jgi:hypothetical protein
MNKHGTCRLMTGGLMVSGANFAMASAGAALLLLSPRRDHSVCCCRS